MTTSPQQQQQLLSFFWYFVHCYAFARHVAKASRRAERETAELRRVALVIGVALIREGAWPEPQSAVVRSYRRRHRAIRRWLEKHRASPHYADVRNALIAAHGWFGAVGVASLGGMSKELLQDENFDRVTQAASRDAAAIALAMALGK